MSKTAKKVLFFAILVLLNPAFGGAASPVLVRKVNGIADPPTSSGRIRFENVGYPDGVQTFFSSLNPVLTGNNVYATDVVRIDNGPTPAWNGYYGGWQNQGDVNDRIYLRQSDDLDPGGAWTPVQTVIDHGQYIHVNDPSVVIEQGVFHMVYTTLKDVSAGGTDPNGVRDWINYSTSTDGINWTPSAGSFSTEVQLTDPNTIALGTITDIARPSLVKTATGWRMWFDALTDEGLPTERRDSYLAESTGALPTDFKLIHRYPTVNGGFPGFFEPDVEILPDGTYVAVVQRNFNELWQATSENGIDFTFSGSAILDADHPLYTRDKVSNPGLLFDQITGVNYGVSFGMTDSQSLVDHDIGFSYSQYIIQVSSPGATPEDPPVWHVFADSELLTDQRVLVFNFSSFELVRIIDPVTGDTILQQDISEAHPGDVWELRIDEELSADFDNDGDVDGKDFLDWQRGSDKQIDATIFDGDSNGDGDVDGNDLGVWQQYYSFPGAATAVAAQSLPEPSSLVISLTLLAMMPFSSRS